MNRFIPCSLATCITERVFACLSFRFLQLSKSCKVCVRACLYIVWTRYSRRKSQRVPANPKSRSKTDAHCLPGLESIYSCIPPYHSISLTRIVVADSETITLTQESALSGSGRRRRRAEQHDQKASTQTPLLGMKADSAPICFVYALENHSNAFDILLRLRSKGLSLLVRKTSQQRVIKSAWVLADSLTTALHKRQITRGFVCM